MENLTLSRPEAKQLHAAGTPETKKFLEEKFGKKLFDNSYMECWQGFCKAYDKGHLVLPHPTPQNPDEDYLNGHFMMMHIIRTKRKKKPDYKNINEKKHFGVFDLSKEPGSGFACYGDVCWDSISICGSRLSIPDDSDLMWSIMKDYEPIWAVIMLEP